jgi:transcription elongation factor GreA
MVKQYFLTDDGLKKYESELEQLKTVKRLEIAEKIKVALSFGDLSENSEYDEAKNEQAKVESRIAELEAMLTNAKVIDEDEIDDDSVHVGSHVRLLDEEFKEEITYHIVGSTEADPKQGRISDESPVGKALLGMRSGDSVTVDAPVGAIRYTVLEIMK